MAPLPLQAALCRQWKEPCNLAQAPLDLLALLFNKVDTCLTSLNKICNLHFFLAMPALALDHPCGAQPVTTKT
jgi:hypothetical protein